MHLANLSRNLPSDTLVSMLRFNETTLDLTIQSESENLNLPQQLKAMADWKIAQLNQRVINDNITMTTLKLQKTEDSK